MSDSKPAIDRREVLERLDGDLELLAALAGVYLEEEGEMTTALCEALASGDPEATRRAAHKIKGAVSNFGAHACVEAALVLEELGHSKELGKGKEAWADLEVELKRLYVELAEIHREAP